MKRMLCLWLMLCLFPFTALALSAGDTGEEVTALQNRLSDLGLNAGKADGIYGKNTSAAVSEAQRLLLAAGFDVPQTGEADEKTLALLYDADCESALLTLRTGSRGQRVSDLQNRLIDLGFLSAMADGVYGSQTEQAVRAFEAYARSAGLWQGEPAGAAAPELIRLLDSIGSASGLQAPVFFDEAAPLSLSPKHLYASSCVLIDAPTGQILFEKNAGDPMYPASTTKILTLLLALSGDGLDETITIPPCASEIPADSSRVPVTPGEQMSLRDLLYGLMLRSGNDAANAVAELHSGSVERFVEEMNEYAAAVGMTGSHFTNPHGYHDDDHYTTAYDLATAARLGMSDPAFVRIVTCMSYTLPATHQRGALTLKNPYEIFDPESEFYIPDAAGIKSGYTRRAGFCYVGAAQRDGRTLIAVLLHVPGRNRCWTDLRRLFAYGFAL